MPQTDKGKSLIDIFDFNYAKYSICEMLWAASLTAIHFSYIFKGKYYGKGNMDVKGSIKREFHAFK